VALVTTGDLDKMDTVERKRIAYRLQLYLTNLTHNGHFFYYDSYFVIIMNAMREEECAQILDSFFDRTQRKIPDRRVYIGVSDQVKDIENLHFAFKRARAAAEMALKRKEGLLYFDTMGLYQMLYLVEDRKLLTDLSGKLLAPILEYDREHNGDYLVTLESYLRNGGSIKAMSEELYIHRNTILYRMANIRKLLGCSLETPKERVEYTVACMIQKM
jgi:DNA-binding PucR family transcriptional regulator